MNLNKNHTPLPPTQTQLEQTGFQQNPSFSQQYAMQSAPPQPNESSLITYNHITYALYAFSFFTAGLTWIIPLVMNYIKRDESRETWLYSHFDWQIKTFWYGIFFAIIAFFLLFFGFGGFFIGALTNSSGAMSGSVLVGSVGVLLAVGVTLWHLYRIGRGWIALTNRRPIF